MKKVSDIFSKAKTSEERVQNILDFFSIEVLNLVIERHNLSEDKRNYFIVRWAEEDQEKEKEYTKEMDKLTEKISMIDEKLYRKGIEKDWRLQILRDIKKVYPNEWQNGFVER